MNLNKLMLLASVTIMAACSHKQEFNYSTAKVQKGDIINTVTATGTIEPVVKVEVGTQVSGIVSKLYVDYNSEVKAGQVIAELDRRNLVSDVNSAKANLNSQRSSLASSQSSLEASRSQMEGQRANIKGQEATIASALNSVAAAKASLQSLQSELEYQKTNFDRQSALYAKGLVSQDAYDQAKLAYIKSQQAVAQQREQIASQEHQVAQQRQQLVAQQQSLANQQHQLESQQHQIESQQHQIESQGESVRRAETNLAYATITSPIDGIVISKEVEEGQTVAASFNTPTLFTIAQDLTDMRVIADVDEADIGEVKEGQHVTFVVDAYPEDVFEGEVTQVRQQATTSSNVVTYQVVISAPNPDLKLKPGLTANVTIYTMEQHGIMQVPCKALKFAPDETMLNEGETIEDCPGANKVWIHEEGKVKAYPVTIGITNGNVTEIKSGVKEGSEVLTDITIVTNMPEEENAPNPFMPRPKDRKGGPKGKK